MTGLGTEERAAVVAAIRAMGRSAPRLLSRFRPPRGERLAAAAARLLALGPTDQAEALDQERALLLTPGPAHVALVHASWLEPHLTGEPGWVARIIAGASAAPLAVRTWLLRHIFAGLVAMPDPGSGSPAAAPAEKIEAAVEAVGRRRLAQALRVAPPEAVAALAARLGEHRGRLFVQELRAVTGREEAGQAVRELGDLVAGSASLLFFHAGARHLAPALMAEGGDLGQQLAQRLPRGLGLVLLGEIARAAERGIPVHPAAAKALRHLGS